MTDNEKRAHDLALFALHQRFEFIRLTLVGNTMQNDSKLSVDPMQNEKSEIKIEKIEMPDIYKEYKKCYSQLIASFNRDFPEEK